MDVESTNAKICKVYEDRSGFGSMAQTIKDVKRYYPEVKQGSCREMV